MDTLRKICCEGLLSTFRSRIHARPRNSRYEWHLHSYIRFASVISNRAVQLPLPNSGQRQAVVRISSRQSLSRYDHQGDLVPGTGEVKDVVEYLVIQRRCLMGKEEPWMIWGTIEESTSSNDTTVAT